MNPHVLILIVLITAAVGAAAEQDSRFVTQYSKDRPTTFTADFPDRAAWEHRAEFLRRQALVSQGLWPMPEKTPLNPVIYGAIDRDAFTIEKVYFLSQPGHYVTGSLYRPKNRAGPFPAVLSPYGHWPDGRFIWRNDAGIMKEIDSGAETDPIAAKTPLQANCAMLARMGCVVFQYDMVGYCDSTTIKHEQGFTDLQAVLRLQSFMGLQTWNSIRAYDFISSLPEVDRKRIAVTGSSSGGTQTIALDACDGRCDASFPMVMVSMNMQGGAVCENAPLYRVGTNNVELASLFAPKPEGMAAANDWTRDFMTRGLPEMKRIWGLFDASDDVAGGHVNFGHNHNLHSRLLQYEFLNKHLELNWPEPIVEAKFEPVEPKQLSVWDDQHPLPKDFLGAPELRAKMTAASDAQLATLDAKQRAELIRDAAKAMVVDELPKSGQVEHGSGWIGRKGSNERVPVTLIQPESFNGTIIISTRKPSEGETASLKSAHVGLLQIEPFASDGFPVPPTTQLLKPADSAHAYLGYTLGYNRSVLANRVHDLLTAIAYAQSLDGVKQIDLLGDDRNAPAVLLAKVVADSSISQTAIDLGGFRFDQLQSDSDERVLPGALKYGDVDGFISACSSGELLVAGADIGAATPANVRAINGKSSLVARLLNMENPSTNP